MGERRNFSSSFSKFLSFLEKRERSNWKNSKEVLPIFRSFFLDFFFLKTLLFFSFGERKWKIGRIKMCAPITLKEICKNKTKVEKALYIKDFRHLKRIFDTKQNNKQRQECKSSCRCFYISVPLRWHPIFHISSHIFRKNML